MQFADRSVLTFDLCNAPATSRQCLAGKHNKMQSHAMTCDHMQFCFFLFFLFKHAIFNFYFFYSFCSFYLFLFFLFFLFLFISFFVTVVSFCVCLFPIIKCFPIVALRYFHLNLTAKFHFAPDESDN